MKFIDLDKQQSQIRFEIDEAIKKVLDHKRFILGPEVYELEELLAKYVALNKQPAFITDEFDVEVSTKVSEKVVSLPMHPYLAEIDQEKVVKKCAEIIKGKYK